MKINRYCAATTNEALQRVRSELGADAVILSNRRVADGIEVVAAIDYDESFARVTTERPASRRRFDAVGSNPIAGRVNEASVYRELANMRNLLETHLSSSALYDVVRQHPEHQEIVTTFASLGFDPLLIGSIVRSIDPGPEAEHVTFWSLLNRMRTPAQRAEAECSRFAFVGPTGAGKTSTIAKLATRFAQEHGRDSVVLISTDGQRLGAVDQLNHFASITGISMIATAETNLSEVLGQTSDRQLVLIDTAGAYPDCPNAGLRQALANPNHEIKSLLTLSAATELGVNKLALDAFKELKPGVVLTKIDEAANLCPLLSFLITTAIDCYYFTDGIDIVDDFHDAHSYRPSLFQRAIELKEGPKVIVDPIEPTTMSQPTEPFDSEEAAVNG